MDAFATLPSGKSQWQWLLGSTIEERIGTISFCPPQENISSTTTVTSMGKFCQCD
jgi:hypothetical protein